MQTISRRALLWADGVVQDLRYGARYLRRAPGLVAVSVVSLGLGFGLNLTLYAGLITIFRHEPTMTDPARIVGVEPGNGRQFSYPNYRDLRDSGTFTAVVGFRTATMTRQDGDRLERVSVLVVTDNFFQGLGIPLQLGRGFAAGADASERAPRTAVLDHPYWRARFGASPDVIDRTLTLDGEVFTIIGVLPEGHRSVTGFMAPGVLVPASALTLPTLDDRGSPVLSVLARLRPGITRQATQAEVTALGAELERRFPEINEGLSQPAQLFPAGEMQFRGTPVGFRLLPVLLSVLFGLVLAIAAINVAGLLLARGAARRHELAVRSALGASRLRVAQALLAECFLLSLVGAAAGLALTAAVDRWNLLGGIGPLPRLLGPGPDLLLPALALVLLTTVVCGLTPALRSSRVDLVAGLRTGGTSPGGHLGLRRAFVVGQVALSLTLLVVAALCLRSQMRIATLDLGFDLDHGVVARVNVEPPRTSLDARLAFADRLRERLERIPGVRSATVTAVVPLGGDALAASFHPAGRSDIPGTRATTLSVGPRYFETLAIPLVEGREFVTPDRAGRPAVAIVNETFARTYFPGRRTLGERIGIAGEAEAEVVGVVRDSRIDTIGEAPKSVVYYPWAQRPGRLTILARTTGDPAVLLSAFRQAIDEVDQAATVTVSTLRDAAGTELAMRRVGTQMAGAIGLVGLLLTLIGLHGVVAYYVASRTAEIGIRLALGATPARLYREVVGQALRLVGVGIVAGAALSLLAGPALTTFLAGLSPADPVAFGGATITLLLVAAVASAWPARRAARVDPAVSLRA
jgi:putative ABC transport system permease protein